MTSRCASESNSLDIISESLDNSVEYDDPVSEKLAAIVRKHCFDEKTKEKAKAIISKFDLPSNFIELVITRILESLTFLVITKVKSWNLEDLFY